MRAEAMARLGLSACLSLALGGATLTPSSALAWCQMTTYSGRIPLGECADLEANPGNFPLAWRRPCTSISFSSAMHSRDLSDAQVRTVFSNAIDTWTGVDCGGGRNPGPSVELVDEPDACTRAGHNTTGRNTNTVLFVNQGWFGCPSPGADAGTPDSGLPIPTSTHCVARRQDPRAFAVTFVWFERTSGEIHDVDIEINEERARYVVCPPEGCPDDVDFENIITHEMGHYFGVAHTQFDEGATMYESAPPGEIEKRTLESDDIEAICTIYPEGALSSTCDPSPRGGQSLDCQPHNCGCRAVGTRGPMPTFALGLSLLSMLWIGIRRRSRAVLARV